MAMDRLEGSTLDKAVLGRWGSLQRVLFTGSNGHVAASPLLKGSGDKLVLTTHSEILMKVS